MRTYSSPRVIKSKERKKRASAVLSSVSRPMTAPKKLSTQHSSTAVTQRYIGIQKKELEAAIVNHLYLDI